MRLKILFLLTGLGLLLLPGVSFATSGTMLDEGTGNCTRQYGSLGGGTRIPNDTAITTGGWYISNVPASSSFSNAVDGWTGNLFAISTDTDLGGGTHRIFFTEPGFSNGVNGAGFDICFVSSNSYPGSINFSDATSSAATSSPVALQWILPMNAVGTSSIPDFPAWLININNLTAATTSFNLEINYSRLSSTTFEFVDAQEINIFISLTQPSITPKSRVLIFPPLVNGVQYWAKANLIDLNGNNIASSSITFFIDFSAEGNASSSIPNTECSLSDGSFLGAVRQGICESITYLFVPSSTLVNRIASSSVRNKAPWGYFPLIQNELSGISASTTKVNLNLSGLNFFFNPLKDGLAVVIVLAAGFYFYHRGKHLDI